MDPGVGIGLGDEIGSEPKRSAAAGVWSPTIRSSAAPASPNTIGRIRSVKPASPCEPR
jgi:hypothetical protein